MRRRTGGTIQENKKDEQKKRGCGNRKRTKTSSKCVRREGIWNGELRGCGNGKRESTERMWSEGEDTRLIRTKQQSERAAASMVRQR